MKPVLLSALLPIASSLASAQLPSALLREGDVLASGNVVDDLRTPVVSEAGGYGVVAIEVAQTGGNPSFLWGTLTGGAPKILRSEQQVGNFDQSTFGAVGLSRTEIAYSGLGTDITTSENAFALCLDDELLAIEGGPSTEPGRVWEGIGLRAITNQGTLSFVGLSSLATSGTDRRFALYFGLGNPPVLVGGETAPGLPAPLWKDGSFLADVSSEGSHSLVAGNLDLLPLRDNVVLMDGVGLELGGHLVQRAKSIPASIGGLPGEEWLLFSSIGINEAGDYHFTSGAFSPDFPTDVVIYNGLVFARSGDIVDGTPLRGVAQVAMNEQGDLAHIWSGDDITPGVLVYDGQVLLREGDALDWDGDGLADPGVTLHSFPAFTQYRMGLDRTIYFVAEANVNGSVRKAFFRLGFDVGQGFCTGEDNSTGLPAFLVAAGANQAAANDLTLFAQAMPPNQFGYFLNSQVQAFIPGAGGSQGNLCLGGAIGRYNTKVFTTGATGTGILTLDLPNTPTPAGSTAITAGQTWNFQAWYRDTNPFPTSNFTEAIAVDFL